MIVKRSLLTLVAIVLGIGLLAVLGSIVQGGDRQPPRSPGDHNDTRMHAPTP